MGRRLRPPLGPAMARILRMPSGRHHYTVSQERVRMRDGVQLLTDVHVPMDTSLGTILIRTPYGRDGLIAQLTAGFFASHGYHVVNQSCRGTFGSGGTSTRSARRSPTVRMPSPGCGSNPGSAAASRCGEPRTPGTRRGR